MHAESDSKPQSESSVADNEEEDHFSDHEIETEEHAMSQEIEEVPKLPQYNMI